MKDTSRYGIRDLPANAESERFVIGCLVINSSRIQTAKKHGLLGKHFFDNEHRKYYETALALLNQGVDPDLDAVYSTMMNEGAGDVEILSSETFEVIHKATKEFSGIDSATNVAYHSTLIIKSWQRRQLIQSLEVGLDQCQNGKANDEILRGLFDNLERVKHSGANDTFHTYSVEQLESELFDLEYLIEGVLSAKSNCLIHGGSKTLKTTTAIEMGLSLASGKPFLGYYKVNRICNVVVMSGESGMPVIQEIYKRIREAKGIEPQDIRGRFSISDQLPKLPNFEDVEKTRRTIKEKSANVLFVDPAYLAMDTSGGESSMFAMGAQLEPMARMCAEEGVTFLLVHHSRQTATRDYFGVPKFTDAAFAGFEQFSRQWISLGRRSAHNPDTGLHELWMHAGGCMGHNTTIGLNVDEGPNNAAQGRDWHVEVLPYSEAQQRQAQTAEATAEEKKQRKEQTKRDRMRETIDKAFNATGSDEWVSLNQLALKAGVPKSRQPFMEVIGEMARMKEITIEERKGSNNKLADHVRRNR